MKTKRFDLNLQEIRQMSLALTLYISQMEKCGTPREKMPVSCSLMEKFLPSKYEKELQEDEFKPTGYYCICNYGGIEVEIDKTCERIRYRFSNSEKVSRWQEIKYTFGGRTYLVCNKRRYYLDQFMRY